MRRLILLGLLAVMAIPAGAAKPDAITQVTVAQLGQALIEASAKHKSDGAIARQIGGMELKERLTEATLARLSANLKAGSKTALALQLLADQSTFLDPPASELPAIPAPDDATQKQMFAAARNYLSQTVQHLPNFLATRTDNRFDNSRRSQDNDTGLYRVGNSSREVSIRNDRETSVGDQMASWGEFGAMLGMVLNDAAWVTWSHWEQTPAGPVAVFRYFVPKAASHFVVYIPVLEQSTLKDREQPSDLMSGFGNPEASLQAYHPNDSNNSVITAKPGYQGLLWLDPSTGTVLRITMEADPSDIAPYERAAMMVQYGPVKIGDGNFTCPVRSLSILRLSPKSVTANTSDQTCRMKGQMGPGGGIPDCESEGSGTKVPPTLWLNETLFTGYHLFKATSQILLGTAPPAGKSVPDAGSQPAEPAKGTSASTRQAITPVTVPPASSSDAAAQAAHQHLATEPAFSTQPAASQAYPAPMLRVTSNLIQLPVLVLSPELKTLKAPIAPDRFSIGFNGGSPFRPKFVRREGDDPLQLAIFLDVRHPQEGLLPKIDGTIASLAPAFLHANDRVSIYAIDCGSLIAAEDVPADPIRLKNAVDIALSKWTARRELRQRSTCVDDAHLWDLLAQVAGRLSTRSGWRAILAVTDGDARKSKLTPRNLQIIAEHDQAAIFALEPSPHSNSPGYSGAESPGEEYKGDPTDLALSSVCELSGGAMLSLEITNVAKAMQEVIGMLRDRYVLEFPRSSELIAGNNVVSVRIDKSTALVRPAGDGVPLTDEALAARPAAAPAAQPLDNPSVSVSTNRQATDGSTAPAQQAAALVAAPQPTPPPETSPSAQTKTSADTGPVIQTPDKTVPGVQADASADISPGMQPKGPADTNLIEPTKGSGETTPVIHVSVNRVLVPVVVRDRQGRAVGDLKQEDFQVFVNNKPRVISGFTIEKRGVTVVNAVAGRVEGEPSAAPAAARSASAAPRIIVFLFDDRHLTLEDLAYSQKAAVKALDAALSAPSDRAVVLSTTGSVNSGLTADRAKLLEAITAVKPEAVFRAATAECVKIDPYQADQIVNQQNESALQDAMVQYKFCHKDSSMQGQTPMSMQSASALSEMEESPSSPAKIYAITVSRRVLAENLRGVQDTYAFIGEVVSKMATLPGQRTLIFISSGFLNVDPAAESMESGTIDLAAQSNVTIDALDARGVYTTVMSASDDQPGANHILHDQYRRAAESQSDAPMANLADGTGGDFFHHSNDLDAGFTRLIETPETAYLLELSLNGVKADGAYHHLKVKVNRDGIDVKARSEFFMPKPAKGN